MDFRLTEEQRLVRDTAREFVDRELIPHVRDWEAKGEVPKSFYRKMASLGFLGAPVPEKYGGAGMDYVSFMLLVEEISRGSSSVRTTVSVQTSLSETSLMWFGSEAQKEAWLVPLAKGERCGEPGDDRPARWKRMGAEWPETVHLEREHRGLRPGVRAGAGDEAPRRHLALPGAEGCPGFQGHPCRDDDEARIEGESDRGPCVRGLPHPEGEPHRQERGRLEPGHADPEQRPDRHRRRSRRRGPGRARSRVEVRERPQGVRTADWRLPVDPRDDRPVGGRD